MHDPASLTRILEGLGPRLRVRAEGTDPIPEDLRGLFSDTLNALEVTIEELRVTNETLVEETGREEAAARSRCDHDRFRHVFDALPSALVVTDCDAVVREANPAAETLLGVRQAEARGKPLAVYVDVLSRRAFHRWIAELDGSRAEQRGELRIKPRNGSPMDVEAVVTPLADGYLAWTLRDLTAHRAAGAGTADVAAAMRALVASLPVAAAAMDLDGRVLVWNEAARALLGWSEDEVVGTPNPAVPDEMAALLDSVRAAAPGSEPLRVEARANRRGGGTLPVRMLLAPMADAGGTVRGTVAVMAAADEPDELSPAPEARGWSAETARRVLLGGGGGSEAAFGERLRAGIAAGLHLGRIRPGDRLPSIRDAAQAAGTDHRVVSAAYQRLSTEGLVEVRNRRGASVGTLPESEAPELGEAAEWLARALAEAWPLQLRVPQLPDLARRWTAAAEVRCACVESTEDDLAALCHELSHQWGLKTFPVQAGAGDAASRRALSDALRDVDLVVTTAFHAHAVRPVAEAMGRPMVVATANPEMVDAVEARLRQGPLTAVVADAAFGERMRAVDGGERLRVVLAGDAAAVDALDPSEPVLLTHAAQRRIGKPLRMLVPPARFVSPGCAAAVARVLVQANVAAARSAA